MVLRGPPLASLEAGRCPNLVQIHIATIPPAAPAAACTSASEDIAKVGSVCLMISKVFLKDEDGQCTSGWDTSRIQWFWRRQQYIDEMRAKATLDTII